MADVVNADFGQKEETFAHHEVLNAKRERPAARVDIKALRSVFRQMEDSSSQVIEKIRRIADESRQNRTSKEETEGLLETAMSELSNARQKIKELESTVAKLTDELNNTTRMIQEIDETIG